MAETIKGTLIFRRDSDQRILRQNVDIVGAEGDSELIYRIVLVAWGALPNYRDCEFIMLEAPHAENIVCTGELIGRYVRDLWKSGKTAA